MKLLPALISILLFSAAVSAADDAASIRELSRTERQVELSLPSGPHPHPGDYKVIVYLPPGYVSTLDAYRVIYVFDGTDLSAPHDKLFTEGLIHPAIFVAIANKSTAARIYDLTPVAPSESANPAKKLEAFGNLIVGTLKPYIDSQFRTLPDTAHTGIIGSSLGGLAACWMGYARPETFGFAGCLQPSLWWNDQQLFNRLINDTSPKTATRFWFMTSDRNFPEMWRNAKRAANGLLQRGWVEGDDLAFLQVHNMDHGQAACRSQDRDMLHFLLRKSPPKLLRAELTNAHGPQLVPIRINEVGEYANAYLDLYFDHNVRTTAINPELYIADASVARITDSITGQLSPVGSGETKITATYAELRASLTVGGFSAKSYPRTPIPRSSAPTTIDGKLDDWDSLPFVATAPVGTESSAGFRFGLREDNGNLHIACRMTDDAWISQPRFWPPNDSPNQDAIEIRVDARPDPTRSLGRGHFAHSDFISITLTPGDGTTEMKLRRPRDSSITPVEGLKTACARTADGYVAEIEIPHAALDKFQGIEWREVRLNLCQHDRDYLTETTRSLWWQPDWSSDANIVGSGTFVRKSVP